MIIIMMSMLSGVDHASTGRQARLGGPLPGSSTSSKPGHHPSPGPDPANPPPIPGMLALCKLASRTGGQVERGTLVAQVSQAIPSAAFC